MNLSSMKGVPISPMIQLQRVHYRYDSSTLVFDVEIQPQEFVTIIGASGAGKSTLFHLLAGFITPQSGDIWLNGECMTHVAPAKRPISMLFQENNLFTHLTVAQNMGLGLMPRLTLPKAAQEERDEIARRVGLSDHLQRYPQQLSGGERQRVALARCLLQKRPILLLDEPFSALDPKLREEMTELLDEVRHTFALTVLMISHHYDADRQRDQRCLVIDQGHIIHDGDFSDWSERC